MGASPEVSAQWRKVRYRRISKYAKCKGVYFEMVDEDYPTADEPADYIPGSAKPVWNKAAGLGGYGYERKRLTMRALDSNITLHADDIAEAEHATFVGRFSTTGARLVFIQDEFIVDNTSLIGLGEILADRYPQACLVGVNNSHMIITTRDETDEPIFMSLYIKGDTRSSEVSKSTLTAYVIGSPFLAQEVIGYLDANYPMSRRATVDWHYMSSTGGATHTSITLDEAAHIKPEYYPWIKDPVVFFQKYLKSTSCLMFLAGAAGTGKTSYLRRMIYENKLHVMVAYDRRLFNSDDLFMSFLGGRSNLLVLEDSEEFLQSRDLGNGMISRFLNASDGLIRPKDKKIIFTTNYKEFKDIDQALLRPGRCFEFVEFRALCYSEAVAAAKAANQPELKDKRDYTLAEIFNQDAKTKEQPTIGFYQTGG